MATPTKNPWKAMIVLSCDHGGLMPSFQRLEDEIRRALDRLDDPRQVREYMEFMRAVSERWREGRRGWEALK